MANLDWLPEQLHPVAYRIGRADELCYQIGREAFQWSRSEPLELIRRREAGMEQLVVTGIRPVPPRISLLFSEAINHLRAAIDNVVFHLAGQTESGPLTDKQEGAVAFPIYSDEPKYGEWCTRNQRRVPQLMPGTQLGDRIQSLQPFKSQGRSVASMEPRVAYWNGLEIHRQHPLVLLQEYSNTDKHRTLRVAVHRNIQQVVAGGLEVAPGADPEPMRTIELGDVLNSTPIGTLMLVDNSPLVGIERPGVDEVVVNPGRELDALIRYVGSSVVPTLVTGEPLEDGLPPQLVLNDNGESAAQRIEAAGYESAHRRIQPVIAEGVREAVSQPLHFPPLED